MLMSSVEEETKNQYNSIVTDTDNAIIHDSDVSACACDGVHENNGDETSMGLAVVPVVKQNSIGLIGSGRRTSVPSVFVEEDDEGVEEKRMRLLVPIDYSTEESEAVLDNSSAGTPNIVAAAEFAKCITFSNPKEHESEEKDRNERSRDRSSKRDGYRNDDLARVGDGRWEMGEGA